MLFLKVLSRANLLTNTPLLIAWQDSDATLRETKRCLREKHDPVSDKVRTLIITHKSFLDNDLLKRKVRIKTDEITLIILPQHKVIIDSVINSFHMSLNHSSKSSFHNEIKRVFDLRGYDTYLDKMIKNCPGCLLLKGSRNRFREFKEAPLPSQIGEVILVDEIHRTFSSKNLRFTVASDCLSRFTKIYPINGSVTKDKFIDIVLRISDDFLFFKKATNSPSLEIRCDQLTAHVAAAKDFRLAERGISLVFHDPKSAGGKQIPELDGRIAKLSKFMNSIVATTGNLNAEFLAWETAREYNRTRSAEGFSPSELWNRQRNMTGETFDPPIEDLRRAIQKTRSLSRKSYEKRLKSALDPCLNIVPYSEKSNNDYFNDSYTPIKLNDLFLLNSAWDKNNINPYFKVSKTDFLPTGLNFDDKLVGARKVGVRETAANAYLFSFDSIRRIIDGNSEAAKKFLSDKNPSAHPISVNGLFQKNCPYRIKPGLSPYSPSVHWSDYEEVASIPEASGPLTRFKCARPEALPQPIEGATAPANQNAQKAHTLPAEQNLQKLRHKEHKRNLKTKLNQKEKFREFHNNREKTPLKLEKSNKNSTNLGKLFKISSDKSIVLESKNIINPNSKTITTRSKSKARNKIDQD